MLAPLRIYQEEAKKLLLQIDSFLSAFEQISVFSFSENDKKQAEYRQHYENLLSSLLTFIEKNDAATLELTALLQKSDSVEQVKHMTEFGAYFEGYQTYRLALLSFMTDTEAYMSDEKSVRLDRNLLQRKLLILRQATLTFEDVFCKP